MPANPNASANATSVYNYLLGLATGSVNRVISGQHTAHSVANIATGYTNYVAALYTATGKWPGIIGCDWGDGTAAQITAGNTGTLIPYWENGGLIQIQIHPNNPWTDGSYSDLTDRYLPELIDPGEAVYTTWMAALDRWADGLEELQDEGVVVLWRPLHEMTFYNTFWWGAAPANGGPSAYIDVWQHMFDYFTTTRGLNNLLWVYATGNSEDRFTESYPGADYVDIVGVDVYRTAATIDDTGYSDLTALGKIFAFTECGPPIGERDGSWDNTITIDSIRDNYPLAVYFLQWHSWTGNDVAIVDCQNAQDLMDDAWVIDRSEIAWEESDVYESDANLMAFYRFNQDATDSSAQGNDLNAYGSPVYISTAGEGGYAVDLERSDPDYFYLSDAAQSGLDITDEISLGAWIRIESFTNHNRLITKFDTTGNQRAYQLLITTDGRVSSWLSPDGSAATSCYTAASLISAGTWYHVALTYDGEYMRVYLNGSLSSNGSYNPRSYSSGIYNCSAQFRVGSRQGDTAHYDGVIDQAFVFNRALSPAEIQSVYTDGIGALVSGTASFSGAGSLSASGLVHVAGAAALSGTGSLSGAGIRLVAGQAALSGSGDLSGVGIISIPGAASLSGTGSLSSSASVSVLAQTLLSGVGALSASALAQIMGAAAPPGVGSLSAIALNIAQAQALLSGTGSLAAIGEVIALGTSGIAHLSGAGSLSASGMLIIPSQAALSGTGALTAIGTRVVEGQAALSGSGDLAGAGVRAAVGSTALSGVGSLAAIALNIEQGQAALSGAGSLGAQGVRVAEGQSAISGVGSLSAIGEDVPGKQGIAALAGVGSLSAQAYILVSGIALLSGAGSLSGGGTVYATPDWRIYILELDSRKRDIPAEIRIESVEQEA